MKIFIHARTLNQFQSTLLMRGATGPVILYYAVYHTFQSTLLMRGATPLVDARLANRGISIHAPHARSDLLTAYMVYCIMYFNPRSSCEERRMPGAITRAVDGFQSTLLMRGATRPSQRYYHYHHISIHAPHARSDEDLAVWRGLFCRFQSTLLMRGATKDV